MEHLTFTDTDDRKIGALRLLLSSAALLSYVSDGATPALLLLNSTLVGYWLYSGALFGITFTHVRTGAIRRWSVWIDLAWYAVLLLLTAPLSSIVFLFFMFSILVASFTQGRMEGIRVTMVAVLIYLVVSFVYYPIDANFDWPRLFLRTVFLVGLGFLISHWGGTETTLKRGLALLKDVTKLSNPRFGVDRSTVIVMERIRKFFSADACLVVYRPPDENAYCFRQLSNRPSELKPQYLPESTGQTLLCFGEDDIVIFNPGFFGRSLCWVRRGSQGPWQKMNSSALQNVVDQLEATAFISVPTALSRTHGRVYITSRTRRYSKEAALFLAHAVQHAFDMLEKVELLDQMVREAAHVERSRISSDIHDTTIQPYIGLKLGLEGVLRKVQPANPLYGEIKAIADMTGKVIQDLRQYVKSLKKSENNAADTLLGALTKQVARFKEYYNLDITLKTELQVLIPDRLAAEVLQIVAEGLNNIRKHTEAPTVHLLIRAQNHVLAIEISNPGTLTGSLFVPSSISERARLLGGESRVTCDGANTIVLIHIPL